MLSCASLWVWRVSAGMCKNMQRLVCLMFLAKDRRSIELHAMLLQNIWLWCLFLRGMNPMTSSRNCTCQQSLVNRLEFRNISVEQGALHSCWAYDALLCMSEIVHYKSAEGEFADCLLSGSLRLRSNQDWQKLLWCLWCKFWHHLLLNLNFTESSRSTWLIKQLQLLTLRIAMQSSCR